MPRDPQHLPTERRRERPVNGVVLVAGFIRPVLKAMGEFSDDDSLIVVDEPDVARKRELSRAVADLPAIRELVEWEYQLPGAADRFHLAHRDLDVRAVVPVQEYAVPFAARLAERYGVPGATSGAAAILRDKHLLRTVTGAAGIANPVSEPVDGPDQVRDFARRYPGPLILKPANRQAAVGTVIVADPAEIDAAWAGALEQDEGVFVPDRDVPLRMLVERYVAGPEYSVEMLVQRGRSLFANVTGKVLYPGSRPVEAGHTVPADIPAELAGRLCAATERLVDAVGFDSGFLHCEWIVSDGTPYLVECAGRMPGDGIVELIRYAWPIDLVQRYVTVLTGGTPEPAPPAAKGAAAVWFLRSEVTGVVESVEGLAEARAVPYVGWAGCYVSPGEHIHELRSSWDRIGAATAFAPTVAEAVAAAREAVDRLRVSVRPD